MRLEPGPNDKEEEGRGQQGCGNDNAKGQAKLRQPAVKKHQRTKKKGDDATCCQKSKGRSECLCDEQRDRQDHQCHTGYVHWKDGRHVQHQDQGNQPNDTRKDHAWGVQFPDDPIDGDEH